jgi:8-oxo-dGTP diphosphatase
VTTYPATYCPDCGTPLDERRVDGRQRRYCPDCERVVWHTPVPAAGVAVVGDRGVLTTERDIDPGRGEWAVPGGHMDAGETPAETAARELREEAGLRVDPDALALLDTHSPSFEGGKHMVVLDYVVPGAAVEGTPEPGPEVASVAWLRPPLSGDRGFVAAHEEIVRSAWARLGE